MILAQHLKMERKFVVMQISMIISAFLLASQPASAQLPAIPDETDSIQLPKVSHSAFKPGERLEFDVSYGWLDAGEAIIEIQKEESQIAGRDVWHVVGKGNSTGTFNWFFKVRDTYETYLDVDGVFPWSFVRDVHEGGYEIKQKYDFDHFGGKVKNNKGKEYKIPLGVQDMISSFYRARAIDFSDAQPNQVFEIQTFVDNEVWPLQIRYLKRETIETDLGTFKCMVFVPVVQEGRIFEEEEDMMVWVTDDENKIPVMAKAKVLVGSITMQLRDYSGLANPVAKVD